MRKRQSKQPEIQQFRQADPGRTRPEGLPGGVGRHASRRPERMRGVEDSEVARRDLQDQPANAAPVAPADPLGGDTGAQS